MQDAQIRQYVDARSAFERLEHLQANKPVGSMFWCNKSSGQYLVKKNQAGKAFCLGARSLETEAIFEKFTEKKTKNKEALLKTTELVEQHQRVNRALRIGRVPNLVIKILNALNQRKIHYQVIGTYALYAYEYHLGETFSEHVMQTNDIDIFMDVRRKIKLIGDENLLKILQSVDKTFERRDDQLYTAINDQLFEVDILRREPLDGDLHPMRLDEEDLYWQKISCGHAVTGAVPFSEVVVGLNGQMARMPTIAMADFVRIKKKLAKLRGRDVVKKKRDKNQALLLEKFF